MPDNVLAFELFRLGKASVTLGGVVTALLIIVAAYISVHS